MGVLDRLLGRKPAAKARPIQTREEMQSQCPHAALMGRWDSVADMGKDDKVSMYVCDSCQATFTPGEGRRLRASTAERLHTEEIARARSRREREAEAAEE